MSSSCLLGTKRTWSIEPGSDLIVVRTLESVSGCVFCPSAPRVCKANQTSAAMMISGTSAPRKKRFKGLSERVPASLFAPHFGVRDQRTDLGLADSQSGESVYQRFPKDQWRAGRSADFAFA